VPDLLRVQVYPVEIFVQYSAFFDERAAAVLSCPLIACAVLLLFLQNRLMHGRAYVNAGAGFSGSRPYPLGWVRWPACIACSLLLMCAAAVPLGLLAVRAGGPVDLVRTVRDASEQLVYSLGIAGSAAAATVCLAFLLACRIRSGGWVSRWLPMAIFVPFAVPSVTLGIGLIRVWNRPLVEVCYESSVVVVMGCVARFLPFAYVALHAGLRQVDPHLEEAAWLATPSWVRVVRKILWPLLRPSVLCGFFIVFLLAFGELGTTLLVIPPGKETLPIKIYNLMHYGAERAVAGISLFVVVLVMAGAGLLWAVSRKTQPLR
jgi:iron(III) transport system permease protein